MLKNSLKLAAGFFAALTLLAACGQDEQAESATPSFDTQDWDSVLKAADGQTLNWYIWGGSDSINEFIDTTYGPALEEFGIELNRVPIDDTADAVTKVINETEAEKSDGSVDIIWINGENFATLDKQNLLFDKWSRSLPNSSLVDFDNPVITKDFGRDIGEKESPWSSTQFQMIYDEDRLEDSELPRSYKEFQEYACNNRGRVTYIAPGPGAFQGTRFIKGSLYELADDSEVFNKFDESVWDEWSQQLWESWNEVEECLWQEGKNYPQTEAELHQLFANNEVDFSITQAIAGAGPLIEDGSVPKTSKAFVFDDWMIADSNYLAIPVNAENKASAMVLANIILEPQFQASQITPESGFGLGYVIDLSKVTDQDQLALLEEASSGLGEAAVSPRDLVASSAPDSASEYQDLIEQGWRKEVLG